MWMSATNEDVDFKYRRESEQKILEMSIFRGKLLNLILFDFFTFTMFFNGYEVGIFLQNFESCGLLVRDDEREDVGAMNNELKLNKL
jgi:hypothetical protein